MHSLQGHHPTIIDGYWIWEIGNVPSSPASLDIRLDMLLFDPSSDDLPQHQPTEIQIDQYLRDKTSPSYKHLRARYWQLILPLVRAKYESTRKRYAQKSIHPSPLFSKGAVHLSPNPWLMSGPA